MRDGGAMQTNEAPRCPNCREPMKPVGAPRNPDGGEQDWQCQRCWKIFTAKSP
jgi:tRNA(Ile2) C34 agmatinyltransferase TiaS